MTPTLAQMIAAVERAARTMGKFYQDEPYAADLRAAAEELRRIERGELVPAVELTSDDTCGFGGPCSRFPECGCDIGIAKGEKR